MVNFFEIDDGLKDLELHPSSLFTRFTGLSLTQSLREGGVEKNTGTDASPCVAAVCHTPHADENWAYNTANTPS